MYMQFFCFVFGGVGGCVVVNTNTHSLLFKSL